MKRIRTGLLLLVIGAVAISVQAQQQVEFLRTDRNAEIIKGKELGIGTARVVSPDQVEVYAWNTVRLRYTAGKAGIRPGGGVRFTFMHMVRWTTFQTERPEDHSYMTVKCSNGNPVKVLSFINRPWSEIIPSEYMDKYDPNYNVVEVIVQGNGLKEGETIDVIIGDTAQGSPGVLVQYFDEHPFIIETYVDPAGDNNYYPMEENPVLEVVAGEPVRLTIVASSNAVAGEPGWCLVRAEDRYGNLAGSYRGKISVRSVEKGAGIREKFTLGDAEKGVYRFSDLVFKKPGTYRLEVSDGVMEAVSNPVVVTEKAPQERIFWGDIHNHTKACDGRGSWEQSYLFGRDVSGLDFCSVSNHDQNLREEQWEGYKLSLIHI